LPSFIEEATKSTTTTLTAASTRPAPFYPEEVPVSSFSSSDLSGSSTSSGVTCLHNGNVYRHKERFTSSNVGLKPEHADQCVQCSCEVSCSAIYSNILKNKKVKTGLPVSSELKIISAKLIRGIRPFASRLAEPVRSGWLWENTWQMESVS
jgi:hypothetical protein